MKGTVPDYSSGLKQDLSCKNIPLLSRSQEKEGPGKTTIGSLLIRSFIDLGEMPVLAVDADPNANLHEALGVPFYETLGCMREEAFSRQIPPGMNRHDYVRFRFFGRLWSNQRGLILWQWADLRGADVIVLQMICYRNV